MSYRVTLEPEDQIIMREILRNWLGWALLAAIVLGAFHLMMQRDAKRLCQNEATATEAVCAQAGMS